MSTNGFLSGLLGRDAYEDETRTYSADEGGTRRSWRRGEPGEGQQELRSVTVERVAKVIAELPAAVARENAVLIVRRTLEAAGVKLSELDASAGAQESKLSSEIERAQKRQKEAREETNEAVRSLEEEIRKAQEACDNVVVYEEQTISRASATLKEVRQVRAYFDLPRTREEENTGPTDRGTQRVLKPSDVEMAQISDTPMYPGSSS